MENFEKIRDKLDIIEKRICFLGGMFETFQKRVISILYEIKVYQDKLLEKD